VKGEAFPIKSQTVLGHATPPGGLGSYRRSHATAEVADPRDLASHSWKFSPHNIKLVKGA